ncbi:MAG: CDP-glycerol glycerophosphotransferase family protein [Anaerovoracaceae bacterium]
MISKVIYYGASLVLNRILLLVPLKKNKVLFLSDVRDDLTGNFQFINNSLPQSYIKVTSLKADRREKHTFIDWLKQSYHIATSGFILLDDYCEATAFIKVRKNQELIQLWHSSGAFKKFAHSRNGQGGDIQRIHPGYVKYTKAITSSAGINKCFSDAFKIPYERVFPTGIPRTDIFFDDEYKEKVKEDFFGKYPELKNKKLVLFAPTYRGTKVSDADYDFEMLDLKMLRDRLGSEYVILVKWHPALYNNINYGISKGVNLSGFEGFVYDFSQFREINDLLFVIDILVTDYSSLIFDYCLLGKPIIHYIFDLEEYDGGRGLYFDFSEYIYGKVAKTKEDLVDAIINSGNNIELTGKFVNKFIAKNDGNATNRVIREFFIKGS